MISGRSFRTWQNRFWQSPENHGFSRFSELTDRTGFNPSLVAQNIDKLLAYTGSRTAITRADVTAIIQRDKKDPIFSLTNALMEKISVSPCFI